MKRSDWKALAWIWSVALAVVVVWSAALLAQIPRLSPSDSIAWDENADTLVQANTLVYGAYFDGQTQKTVLGGVLCIAPGAAGDPFVCSARLPLLTPGRHVLTLSAATDTDESPRSTPFTFDYFVPAGTPRNVRKK